MRQGLRNAAWMLLIGALLWWLASTLANSRDVARVTDNRPAVVTTVGPVCYQRAEDDPLPASCKRVFANNPDKHFDYHDGAWWIEGSAGYHPGR